MSDRESDSDSESTYVDGFHETCKYLKRNDPEQTCVGDWDDDWPVGYARVLGEAIVDNTVVSDIWLSVNDALCSSRRRNNAVLSDATIAEINRSVELLLRFVRTSPTLRVVKLDHGNSWSHPMLETFCGSIMNAIAQNSVVEKLKCTMVIPASNFANLLRTTRSLKTLEVCLDYFITQNEDNQLIADAFGVNQTLEKLHLEYENDDDHQYALADAILSQLGNHPKLESIDIESGFTSGFTSLSLQGSLLNILQSKQSKVRRLVLSCFGFDEESGKHLFDALESSVVLESLTLNHSQFNRGAMNMLMREIQRWASASNIVREHPVELQMMFRSDSSAFQGTTFANVLARLLTTYYSVSDLRRVHWRPVGERDGTLLRRKKSLFRLTNLCLHDMGGDKIDDVAICLPYTIHLHTLRIPTFETNFRAVDCDFLLHALQCNGSLHHVTVGEHTNWPPPVILSPSQLRLAQAYCDRNRLAPELSSTLAADPEGVSVLPPLFASVQPAWNMAPNTMLRGLLAASAAGTPLGLFQGTSKMSDGRCIDFDGRGGGYSE